MALPLAKEVNTTISKPTRPSYTGTARAPTRERAQPDAKPTHNTKKAFGNHGTGPGLTAEEASGHALAFDPVHGRNCTCHRCDPRDVSPRA